MKKFLIFLFLILTTMLNFMIFYTFMSTLPVTYNSVDDAPQTATYSKTADLLSAKKSPKRQHDILDELDLLSTGGKSSNDLECPPPLTPFHNKIVRDEERSFMLPEKQIPRIIHMSFKSRCVTRDHAMYLDRWKKKFPDYSIFLHDDEAVARFIGQDWREFPDLHKAMKCVLFKGAMTIDVWRVLVVYKYGGVYSDIDNWPLDNFSDKVIPNKVSAFFFTDAYNRPSQWFICAEPSHPIMYMSAKVIIDNVLNMKNIKNPRVVLTTGPNAFKIGYFNFLAPTCCGYNLSEENVFKNGEMKGILGKTTFKMDAPGMLAPKMYFDDIVPYNSTLNVTRGERIGLESGVMHWPKKVYKTYKAFSLNGTKFISCKGYLKGIESGDINEIKGFSR